MCQCGRTTPWPSCIIPGLESGQLTCHMPSSFQRDFAIGQETCEPRPREMLICNTVSFLKRIWVTWSSAFLSQEVAPEKTQFVLSQRGTEAQLAERPSAQDSRAVASRGQPARLFSSLATHHPKAAVLWQMWSNWTLRLLRYLHSEGCPYRHGIGFCNRLTSSYQMSSVPAEYTLPYQGRWIVT
jgi:hypothetical protein